MTFNAGFSCRALSFVAWLIILSPPTVSSSHSIQPAGVPHVERLHSKRLSDLAHVSLPVDGTLDAKTETFPILVRKVCQENGLLVRHLRVGVNERYLSCQVPSRIPIGYHFYSRAEMNAKLFFRARA